MIDVIVVGAGPAGLSCAIEAKKAGLSTLILEKGSLVDSIRRFPSAVVWFSTPELLEIGEIPFVTSSMRPTRIETLRYYQRVTQHFGLEVRYFDPVEHILRDKDGFQVQTRCSKEYRARNIVIATGYFDHPNRLSVPGEDLPHVSHYYDEPFKHFDRDVVVVGGRNSAVEAALDLYRNGSRVLMIHRGETLSAGIKYWILPDIENRIKNGEIKAFFSSVVEEIRPGFAAVKTPEGSRKVQADFVFILVGFRPDVEHLRRFGVEIDSETLAPLHDPATFETNMKGLFVAGSIVAGKNNNKVFVENGRLHGRAIVESIIKGRS